MRGITLIEVLITTSLFVAFTVIFFFNFPILDKTASFNSRIVDISSSFRLLQFSGSNRGGEIGGKKLAGDGFNIINAQSTNYLTYFFDVQSTTNSLGIPIGNKIYDTNDVQDKIYNFKDFLYINKIRLLSGNTWIDMPNGQTLSVVYDRPSTNANIYVVGAPQVYDAVCIEFRYTTLADTINKKSIIVEKFGQINSYNAKCN